VVPFVEWATFVGTLALIVVLLEAGFKLSLTEVITRLPEAGGFAVASFALSALAATAALHYVFGWQLLYALFTGVILGGYSSNVVLPIISKLSASAAARTLVSLESVINDVFCIVFAFIVLGVMGSSGSPDLAQAGKNLASAFTTAIVIGVIAGVFWMKVLRTFQKNKPLAYVVTLALAFILYAFAEAAGGNGAIAVLVFGLALGNGQRLAEAFKWQGDYAIATPMKDVQTAVVFFVNTFFFVYLGLLFDFKTFNELAILVTAAVLVALYAGRAIAVYALTRVNAALKDQSRYLMWFAPRGLAAAVLAFLPASQGKSIPGLVETAFLAILATNIIAAIATFVFEQPAKQAQQPQAKAPQKPRIVR